MQDLSLRQRRHVRVAAPAQRRRHLGTEPAWGGGGLGGGGCLGMCARGCACCCCGGGGGNDAHADGAFVVGGGGVGGGGGDDDAFARECDWHKHHTCPTRLSASACLSTSHPLCAYLSLPRSLPSPYLPTALPHRLLPPSLPLPPFLSVPPFLSPHEEALLRHGHPQQPRRIRPQPLLVCV